MYQELKLVQNAELYILKEIKRICEKHDIKYFLTGGTMLGAVRHQGFIPWDDDIDIAMVREEYERFLSVAPTELGEEFFLDNEKTDDEYGLVFTKVRLLGTKFVELKGNANAKHNELFVDVFSYFNVSDSKTERSRIGKRLTLLTQLLLVKSGYHVWRGDGFAKTVKFFPVRVMSALYSRRLLRERIDSLVNKYPNRTEYTCPNNGSKLGYLYWILPRTIFDEYISVKFEDDYFLIPKEYETCLKTFYGTTFMELPPEEKRITHRPTCLDLGRFAQ